MGEESALPSFGGAFQTYAYSWVFNFAISIMGALIANGIWSVPLFQVVNVNLSIALFFAIAALVINVLVLVIGVLSGQAGAAAMSLFGVLLSCLVPFAPIAAYELYAWLGGLNVAQQSFVYDDFMTLFTHTAKTIASALGQLSVLQPPEGSTDKAIDLVFGLKIETLERILASVASVIAIVKFLTPSRETAYAR